MLIKLTDWMANEVSDLSDEQIQDMLRSEHGGLNEVLQMFMISLMTGNISNWLTVFPIRLFLHRFYQEKINLRDCMPIHRFQK